MYFIPIQHTPNTHPHVSHPIQKNKASLVIIRNEGDENSVKDQMHKSFYKLRLVSKA